MPTGPERGPSTRILGQWASLLSWHLLAKAALLVGQVIAIRNLGPEELGRGAAPMAIALASVLMADRGLDAVSVRRCAMPGPIPLRETLGAVTLLRLPLAAATAVLLMAAGMFTNGDAWLWGICAGCCFVAPLQPGWVYQHLGRTPLLQSFVSCQIVLQCFLLLALVRPGSSAEAWAACMLLSLITGVALQWIWLHFHGIVPRRPDPGLCDSLAREGRITWIIGILVAVYTGLDLPLLAMVADHDEVGHYRAALIFLHLAQPLLLTISSVCYPLIAGQSGLPTPDWGRVLRWWRLSAFIGLGLIASTPVIALLVVPVLGTDFQAAVLPGAILVTAKGVAIMGAIPALALIASGRAAQQAVIAAVATCGFLATWLLSAPHQGSVAAAGSVLIAELVVTTAASAAFLSSLRKRSS